MAFVHDLREPSPMKVHNVAGAAGINLHVREWGARGGVPVLLIHGWSQSHLCWIKQYENGLRDKLHVVAFDLRGHGMSDSPLDAEQYTDGDRWADDIAAIIEQLALEKPILVGWSYGGFIICDYVRKHGQDKISGINFVSAAVVIGPAAFGRLIGPGFLDNAALACERDLPTSTAAMRKFLRVCFVRPISQDDFETALAFNMVVAPEARAFLIQRELDFAPVLETINCPVLVTHGRSDIVVLPAMSHYILDHCRTAEASWYDGTGHAPFLEWPERFNEELVSFARRLHG
jgi:pimeloyl-ACP methyl ester carboxylesterase